MKTKMIIFSMLLGFCCCQAAENLIKNGEPVSGNSPIQGLEFNAAGPQGSKCFTVPQGRKMYMGQKFIAIDPNGEYEFSAEICGDGKNVNNADIGLVLYDEKKQVIPHSSVNCAEGSDAVTAAPVERGSKVILLKNAGDWETFLKGNARVVAMGAKKDFSDLPNRNLCYYAGKITRKGDIAEVQLSYGAAKAYPAGTPVRLHRDGGYQWCLLEFQKVPEKWTKFTVRISGTAEKGAPKKQFWKSTRFVKPVFYSRGPSALFIRNLSLIKVEKAK